MRHLLTLLSLLPALALGAPRPNFVLILCDDLGYADVGFNGGTEIQTPHLDRLAEGGVVFTSAYVCHPFCGPSRMGLMTGRDPHQLGVPFNLPNSGLGIEAYNAMGVPESEELISSALQRAGYRTGAIGKWHLGHAAPFHPNQRGFDDFFGFLGGGHLYFPERFEPIADRQEKAQKEHRNEYQTLLEHNGESVREGDGYLTDILSREAARFLREAAAGEKPFFLYLAYNAPHTPLEATEEDVTHYAHIKDEKRRNYAGMMHAVDRGVGEVIEALIQGGALDNTLVLFMSDNGGKTSAGADNGPLAKHKGSVMEGGWRVPMFAHWPDRLPAKQRYPHPVSSLDLYPTLVALAEAELAPGKKLDGIDIGEAVVEGRPARAGQPLFAMRHWGGWHDVGMRVDQWKLTREATGGWRLYDVENDPGETKNLAARHPERVATMVQAVERWTADHREPLFFHEIKARDTWIENQMPRFEGLFTEQ